MKHSLNDFIDNNLFLWDAFDEQIILSKMRDRNAPPERYFEVGVSPIDGDVYIDTYWIDRAKKQVIDFAYHYYDSWIMNPHWSEGLYLYLESHGLPRISYQIKRRQYPRKRFKRLLKKYFLDFGRYHFKYDLALDKE